MMFGRDVITRFDRLKQNTLNTKNEMKCNNEKKNYKGKITDLTNLYILYITCMSKMYFNF